MLYNIVRTELVNLTERNNSRIAQASDILDQIVDLWSIVEDDLASRIGDGYILLFQILRATIKERGHKTGDSVV